MPPFFVIRNNMSHLELNSRPELNPFDAPFFCLCKELFVSGFKISFGDQIPNCDLNHLHHHYRNGVVGTGKELESLKGEPITLHHNDPLGPVAMFVQYPNGVYERAEEKEDVIEKTPEEELTPFSLEAAALLGNKKSLAGYSAQYGIDLKISSSITLKSMLTTLEKVAKEKGLVE